MTSWKKIEICKFGGIFEKVEVGFVAYPFTIFIIWKMFGENIQNINIWTDDPFSQFKNRFILSTLVITYFTCFLIITWHGVIQLQVMERGQWIVLEAP